jgi:hypothetical protein
MSKADVVQLLRDRADQREKEANTSEMLNNASVGGKVREALLLVAHELRAVADELEAE